MGLLRVGKNVNEDQEDDDDDDESSISTSHLMLMLHSLQRHLADEIHFVSIEL